MADITILNGAYKPTYNWGGTILYMVDFQDFQVPPKNATRSLLLHTLQKPKKSYHLPVGCPGPP